MSAATGWSVEDCLNFKLAFKKRDDAKTVKDAMGTHFKRLRAVGWHLHKLATRLASFPPRSSLQVQHRPNGLRLTQKRSVCLAGVSGLASG